MIYKFIDNNGTFTIKNPQKYNIYFPLTDKDGKLLSSISPNLSGDIKADNDHFLTPPASIEDLRSNLLCRRNFFIKTGQKIIRLSDPYNDIQESGFLYHKIIKKINSLHVEILNFTPYDCPVEIMRIEIINKSKKPIEITPTSFLPLYGRSAENVRDHRHVSSLLNRIHLTKYGILLKPTMTFDERGHKANETTYFCLGFENNLIAPLGQFPTLDYFCGGQDLIKAAAIEKNVAPVRKNKDEFNGKEAVAAFRFKNKVLKSKEKVSYFLIMGITSGNSKKTNQQITRIFAKLNSPAKINQSLQNTKKYWRQYLTRTSFDFGNKDYTNWLMWVKLQPTLRKLFGCSFLPHFDYGKGGRGWRDLWQDALTLLLNEPLKAKSLILNSFQGVKIDGSNATIITKKGDLISDRNSLGRVWMDHGVWPYLTLKLYINRTGDLDILNKDISYFKDHLLRRAKEVDVNFSQNDYILRTKKGKIHKGSVLEHILVQHLTSFFNVGKHNIIKLENADWNDGLDMAAQEGESVTFSFMYARNLADLCFFLKNLKTEDVLLTKELILLLDRINRPLNYNNSEEKQKRLQEYLEKTKHISGRRVKIKVGDLISDLEEKSKHLLFWLKEKEWLKLGFFNGYYDNKGKKVEGRFKNKIKMMLASQVFAIMSGAADKNQIQKIWVCAKKYLKSNKLGGFRLNTDFGHLYLDLGRAFGFSYGDKENGAVFNHMTIMFAYALYSQGFIKEANEAIDSVYKMSTDNKAKIPPLIPEYFNLLGCGLYLYLTGSASWYMHNLTEQILGIKFILGDIALEPKLTNLNFSGNTINVNWPINKKMLNISYIKRAGNNKLLKIKDVFLEKEKIEKTNNRYLIEIKKLSRINKKNISLKVYLA